MKYGNPACASLALERYFQMSICAAAAQVFKRLLKTVALRQLMGILAAMIFVRFAMEPVIKAIRSVFRAPTPWERSTEFYVLREVSLSPSLLCLQVEAASRIIDDQSRSVRCAYFACLCSMALFISRI